MGALARIDGNQPPRRPVNSGTGGRLSIREIILPLKRIIAALLIITVLGAIVLAAISWRRTIDPIQPPSRESFDSAMIARGAQLEALGDCNSCHTAPGGRLYAGGRALETPFGTVYSTNITPDAATGIGRWSEEAFARSMREGVDREGRHLYPAFPYDHFRLVSDADIKAIYAYLMTREPVRARAPANELVFPLGFRPLLAGWKWLYLEQGAYVPDAARSAEWNRGAYLAEGLGHCGACHTPRNALGAERRDRHFAGGTAEGWHAPALDASSPSPVPWTEERLVAYLANEVTPLQGIAAGPMLPVAHNLALVSREDVAAIAAYVAWAIGKPAAERQRKADEIVARVQREEQLGPEAAATQDARSAEAADPVLRTGAELYAGACAICHGSGRGPSSGAAMHLAFSTTVALGTPTNFIHVTDDGITPRAGERGRWMPAFRGAFTDQQLAALAAYVRSRFSIEEPWRDLEREVQNIRRSAGGG